VAPRRKIQQKNVAFEVYQRLYGHYVYRLYGLLAALLDLVGIVRGSSRCSKRTAYEAEEVLPLLAPHVADGERHWSDRGLIALVECGGSCQGRR
jgi:hypothetical protein